MNGATQNFAWVKINALLRDVGWNPTNDASVLYEFGLPDSMQAGYVLCDRQGQR